MLTDYQLQEIICSIEYKPNWMILLHLEEKTKKYYVQIRVNDTADAVTKKKTWWKSGKRYLSPHMCRQEIVGVCWALIQDSEMHEAREWFRYKGAAIYNAHLDPDALVEVASRAESFNCRDNSMTMEETS